MASFLALFLIRIQKGIEVATSHVFTYGSLMFADIFEGVTEERCRQQNATLNQWQRYALLDRTYPGAANCQDLTAQIKGVLWFDVSAQALLKLDAFEGREYRRQSVTVLCESTQPQTAWIYRWLDESLFSGAWHVDAFEHQHRADFVARHWQTPSEPPTHGQ